MTIDQFVAHVESGKPRPDDISAAMWKAMTTQFETQRTPWTERSERREQAWKEWFKLTSVSATNPEKEQDDGDN